MSLPRTDVIERARASVARGYDLHEFAAEAYTADSIVNEGTLMGMFASGG